MQVRLYKFYNQLACTSIWLAAHVYLRARAKKRDNMVRILGISTVFPILKFWQMQ